MTVNLVIIFVLHHTTRTHDLLNYHKTFNNIFFMSFLNLYIKPNYKLYILLFKYNLNMLYIVNKSFIFHWSNCTLHKKWLRTNEVIFYSNNQLFYKTSWGSKSYFYQNNNFKLTKYIQVTAINFNSNRNLCYTVSASTNLTSRVEIYNAWFRFSHKLYNQQWSYSLLFLKSFLNINLFNFFIKLNQNTFLVERTVQTLKLLHNIKFL